MTIRLRLLLLTALLVGAAPCHSFKLQPLTKEIDTETVSLGLGLVFQLVESPLVRIYVDQFSTPVHEDLTHRTYGCAAGHARCRRASHMPHGAPQGVIEGVQWNDNPPFTLDHPRLTISPTCFRVTIQLPNLNPTCWANIYARGVRVASTRSGVPFGPRDTLLERSHFGDLQFLHAMGGDGEPADVTRRNVLAWAQFAYLVSIGEIGAEAKVSDGDAVGPRIAKYFPENGWTVMYLFTRGTAPRSEERLRDIAFGSLLHVVQDSFSRAHVAREDVRMGESGPVPGRIVQFHSYARQDPYLHGKMDDFEGLAQAHDTGLITAIGMRLVELRARRAPWDEVLRALEPVFELSEAATAAGPGNEFIFRPSTPSSP